MIRIKIKNFFILFVIIFSGLLLVDSSPSAQTVKPKPNYKLTSVDSLNITKIQWVISPLPDDYKPSFNSLIKVWYIQAKAKTHNSDSAFKHTLDSVAHQMDVLFYHPYPKNIMLYD